MSDNFQLFHIGCGTQFPFQLETAIVKPHLIKSELVDKILLLKLSERKLMIII